MNTTIEFTPNAKLESERIKSKACFLDPDFIHNDLFIAYVVLNALLDCSELDHAVDNSGQFTVVQSILGYDQYVDFKGDANGNLTTAETDFRNYPCERADDGWDLKSGIKADLDTHFGQTAAIMKGEPDNFICRWTLPNGSMQVDVEETGQEWDQYPLVTLTRRFNLAASAEVGE